MTTPAVAAVDAAGIRRALVDMSKVRATHQEEYDRCSNVLAQALRAPRFDERTAHEARRQIAWAEERLVDVDARITALTAQLPSTDAVRTAEG